MNRKSLELHIPSQRCVTAVVTSGVLGLGSADGPVVNSLDISVALLSSDESSTLEIVTIILPITTPHQKIQVQVSLYLSPLDDSELYAIQTHEYSIDVVNRFQSNPDVISYSLPI